MKLCNSHFKSFRFRKLIYPFLNPSQLFYASLIDMISNIAPIKPTLVQDIKECDLCTQKVEEEKKHAPADCPLLDRIGTCIFGCGVIGH